MRNQNALFAVIVLSFDIGVILGISPDIEGSLEELSPPSANRDISVPHSFKRAQCRSGC
jgi:hypothetical protein